MQRHFSVSARTAGATRRGARGECAQKKRSKRWTLIVSRAPTQCGSFCVSVAATALSSPGDGLVGHRHPTGRRKSFRFGLTDSADRRTEIFASRAPDSKFLPRPCGAAIPSNMGTPRTLARSDPRSAYFSRGFDTVGTEIHAARWRTN